MEKRHYNFINDLSWVANSGVKSISRFDIKCLLPKYKVFKEFLLKVPVFNPLSYAKIVWDFLTVFSVLFFFFFIPL
jgi:hypothetical protein